MIFIFARRKQSARAMTLVEILAVVVILGILVATLTIGISATFGKAKHELARSGIGVLVGKVELYHIEKGEWPHNDVGLAVLSDEYARATQPYFVSPDKLLDPWNRRYLYLTPGPDSHPFEIISHGADGQPGGVDENADISSTRLRDMGGDQ